VSRLVGIASATRVVVRVPAVAGITHHPPLPGTRLAPTEVLEGRGSQAGPNRGR